MASTSGNNEKAQFASPSSRADPVGDRRAEEEVVVGRKRVEEVAADSGRERLKRHRREMAGTVRIPETWVHEKHLVEWTDCAAVDRSLFPVGLLPAREALVEECRRRGSTACRVPVDPTSVGVTLSQLSV